MASPIKRTGEYGGLLHEVVEHGDTIYFAGLVSEDLKLDMTGQTKDVLAQLDALLKQHGSSRDKSYRVEAQSCKHCSGDRRCPCIPFRRRSGV